MKFYSRSDAARYLMTHTPEFRKKLRVVACRHWSMDAWAFVPCYTVVIR